MKDWSVDQQEKVSAFMQPRDYNATFFGKLLLIHALKKLGTTWNWDDIAYTSKERPYLIHPDIDFNLSHSGQYVTLAIGSHPLGIDIEMHRPVKLELFNRQFQEKEWQVIRNAENQLGQFFHFWSIKEAAIKADGRGVEVLSRTEIISNHQIQVEDKIWNYQSFDLVKGYSMAVCSDAPFYFKDKDVQTIHADILLEKM